MFGIEIEVQLGDGDVAVEGGGTPPQETSDTLLLEALAVWWAHNAAARYESLPPGHKFTGAIPVPWSVFGTDATFEVAFDRTLLENALEIYTTFGWEALEEIEKHLEDTFPRTLWEPATKFLHVTKNVVAVMVAQELVELEQRVADYAHNKWLKASADLQAYFNLPGDRPGRDAIYRFEDKKLLDKLFDLCREYALEARKAAGLQRKVEERSLILKRGDPRRRLEGSGWQLWFEVYASPQRESMKKLADLTVRIRDTYFPAVLILDALPDAVLSAKDAYDRVKAKVELENLLGSTLDSLISDLQSLRDSLKEPRATADLVKFLGPMLSDSRDFSQLGNLRLPEGGFEQHVLDVVVERTGKSDNRLLANLDLLLAFYDDPEGGEPGSWSQVVLYRYCARLTVKVDEMQEDEAFWDEVWGWVGRVAALTALVALMAVFPFGEAAAAPALVSILTVFGSISAVLGVLTLLHDVLDTLQEAGKLEADARDRLFRLGQTEPEAIVEIGQLLSRSRALRGALYDGLLVQVLTLAAARKLKVVATALDFQGFIQDVETLFAPAADG